MPAPSVLLDQLGEVGPEAVAELCAVQSRSIPAGSSSGSELFTGFSFLVVDAGFVVIQKRVPHGRAVVICHAGAGALLTAPELDETLDALVAARVTLLSETTYERLLANPKFAPMLSDGIRSALRQKRDSLANFAGIRPIDRVEAKLLQLAREHGRVVPDGVRLDFPITHELLAEMIGAARETVSRAIERLESNGFVVRDGRSYRLQVSPETIQTL